MNSSGLFYGFKNPVVNSRLSGWVEIRYGPGIPQEIDHGCVQGHHDTDKA